MNTKMKTISIGMAMVLTTLMTAACAQKESGGGSAAGGKKAALDFVWFSDGNESALMKGIIEEYEAKNTNVEINMIEVPYKDLSTKLKTMISGGKPPALARISTSELGAFANQAVDLGETNGGLDAYTGQFVDSLKPFYVVNNKAVAAPMDVTANGLIYNKTLFDKAGVKVPTSPDALWTWDEFAAALKQVMDKGGAKYGLVWDYTPQRWSTLLYQFGGSLMSADGTKAAINNEAGVQAAEFFKKLHTDGIAPTSVWLGGENPNNLFRSGTVAAHLAGNWMISNYKDISNFEWGVTYMPKAKQRSSVPGGKFAMAFKKSGVEKEAADFINYITTKEVNAKYTREALFLSPRKDNAKLDYAFGKEMMEVFSNELNSTAPAAAEDWSKQTIVPKFSNDLKKALSEIVGGKTPAQEGLDEVAGLIDKAISEDKK
ncbi:ABC transporter substrate-binding protein [Paenibacillus mucilaginosus]|uniref:Sugar-binding periplasmic protein/domain protein n=1 Tax=Paenibacillus mucilaginosus (strain KNP414) TaxID=1036673 RepID=F8F7S3_PAEMK|nr:sugar ABC transporter substrate-binding protein [Paenibacillus mucilaginosus]AEI40827.1 Sugar-binding periplasmic protein/domain protein [Paenibacillus mucilaginosus KNP414]MCG7211704.1 sugar ABC transporter substrate-binding protein [Paenibacillus mucilaginosus]WDM29939.1 sugar ABC transporter substrate-binding protein [Paenibacillus mucilaginosus]